VAGKPRNVHLQGREELSQLVVKLACDSGSLVFAHGLLVNRQFPQLLPRALKLLLEPVPLGDVAQHTDEGALAIRVQKLRGHDLVIAVTQFSRQPHAACFTAPRLRQRAMSAALSGTQHGPARLSHRYSKVQPRRTVQEADDAILVHDYHAVVHSVQPSLEVVTPPDRIVVQESVVQGYRHLAAESFQKAPVFP
jgi:hypothetical protein